MYRKVFYLFTVILVLGLAGIAGATEGLIGEYYHGSSSDGWDDLVMQRIDPTVDFNWGDYSPEAGVVNVDGFKVRWTGEVEIPTSGTYTFHTQTDDGVRLWVNDIQIIDNWTDHGSTHDSGNITLVGGQRYPIKLEWYENGGGAICQLSWDGPAIERQVIPSGYLWVGGDRPNAHNPTPVDGTLIRDTWLNLSWVAGDFAATHDIYLGENSDEVEAGTGDTFRGNQTDTNFTIGFPGFPYPDGLEAGKTYYWRVDEVEADGATKTKGEVWSFSIAPKTIYDPEPADGAEGVDPNNVTLKWEPGFGAILNYVYFGDDYDTVSNAAAGMPWGSTNYPTGPLESGKVYYWKVDAFHGFATYPSEVMSFSTAGGIKTLKPSNGAENVNQTQILTWEAGNNSTSYQVYFGADKDAVRNADTSSPEYKGSKNLDSESFDPGLLEWDTDYFWRVDEVKADGTTQKGMVWSFTAANFFIVDDMDSYNDLDPADPESNRIFNAWIDGYGDATNGALVGYDQPPFAEQTIVHSGNQSMPFEYDNTAGKSEATLTLTELTDWTEKGVNRLTIWYQGKMINSPEQMYVALNGSAVVNNDDPEATLAYEWTEWNIDLQAFADQGVNLANVNSITLGVSSVAGGTGILFFDDIRLYVVP
jgi:hypothetical protein